MIVNQVGSLHLKKNEFLFIYQIETHEKNQKKREMIDIRSHFIYHSLNLHENYHLQFQESSKISLHSQRSSDYDKNNS
jgi:hypothetical protein